MGKYTVWGAVFSGLAKIGEVLTGSSGETESDIAVLSTTGVIIGGQAVTPVLAADNKSNKSYQGYIKNEDLEELTPQTVTIPQNFAGLEAVMVPTRLQEQLFRIVEVVENEDYVEITARHVWYDSLQNYTYWKPDPETSYSAAEIARHILNWTTAPANMRVASDCTDTIIGKDIDYDRKNLVECLLDPEKGLCAKFGLSLIRNNWDCYILKEVGYNRGIVIENGKNLLGVERKESLDPVITRIAPIGKDEQGKIVWMNFSDNWYVDSGHIVDYSYPRCEIYDTGLQIGKDGVTAENIHGKLFDAANKRFQEDYVDVPVVEMTIEFLSLGDTEEYQQYRDLDKVYLYDILSIKDTIRGYQYTAQVVAVEHDLLTGMLNSVTIGKLDNWDGTRKIAVWQVPEIDGANIRLQSILAGTFAPGAIFGADIANDAIDYAHFKTATIDALTADSIDAVTARIHQIIAGSITADDIYTGSLTAEVIAAGAITTEKLDAGAVTTAKLDAYAVTAAKIAAGAITTEKLDANAVTADKISATDIAAINAKLGTANIASAVIAEADINFAHIKDLNAESAYFGQAIFDEAVGGKLYVPRLAVGYAQMLGATIGDLVIQASNGNYYALDVNDDGEVISTQRTVTAGEIASGHTTDGKTLVLGTDILASDLNTDNIYASHALMDEITAQLINVDQLWARSAFIGKLMTTDITSNTYLQATIGNWTSGSTITQTINSLDSRISSLGYGTVYCQPDEPMHGELVSGDIWIQTLPNATWNDIYNNYASWQDIYDDVSSWQVLGGIPKMFVWDGQHWQELYDADLPNSLTTQIQQLSDAITLKASISEVNALGEEVELFAAELTVQAQEIQSAVSAVNTKASSYVMLADPRSAYTVSIGDIWIKSDHALDSWQDVYDNYSSWQDIYDDYATWEELLGASTYVWNGTEWIETSDRAREISLQTRITETERSISILASETAEFQSNIYSLQASINVTAQLIAEEVTRATNAENGKLSKTGRYQSADDIVSVASTNIAPLFSTSTSYTKGQIVSYNGKIYQFTADHPAGAWNNNHAVIITANSAYIAKTEILQTASDIVLAAKNYTDDYAYGKQSGIGINAAGVAVSGNKYIKLDVNENNYVHIDPNGIDVKGNRIKVNEKEVFARDDIIIMNPNATETWRRTVAGIEGQMSGKHDWVLIRPYYDARIDYNYHGEYTAQAYSVGSTPKSLSQESGIGDSFGASTNYRYVFRCTVPIQQTISLGITLTLCDTQNMIGNVVTSTQTAVVSTSESTNLVFNITSPINFCTENSAIWFKLECDGRNVGGISNISLECYCDATVSRVPCTTYYYP